jgi:hypothetical protein
VVQPISGSFTGSNFQAGERLSWGSLRSTPGLRLFLVLVALLWTQFPFGGGAHAEGAQALKLCCAWGSSLADGELTFSVGGGDPETMNVMRAAVKEWDDVLAGMTLSERPPGSKKIDIAMTFVNEPGRTEGQAVTSFTRRGLIKKVDIEIQGGPAPANTGGLLQISKHEFGHALGLGHANFDGNLMSEAVSPQPSPIESCVIQAVVEANRWRMIDPQAKNPQKPGVAEVAC